MKQNGEPNDAAANNGHRTNGDELNGKKRNREIIDNHDIEMGPCENLGSVFDLRKAQLSVAKLSCVMGAPIGTDEAYLDTLKYLNPSFHLAPDQYKEDILQVFEEEKARVKGALANLDSQICLSVDTFCELYLQLSAHFIDEKWDLKKWVLKFCRSHTFDREAFVEAVLNTLKDWEIEGKVLSFTMVGALHRDYELVKTFKNFVEEKRKLPLGGKLCSVECCARIFNEMAEDAYKEISDVISKVQRLIPWKFPPVWYLPAYKLKEALELESMGEFSTKNIRDDYGIPSVEEWEKARCVSNLVIALYETVKTLFETKYPTANNFLHKLQELRAKLFQEASSADDFKSKISKKMLERLDKYWDGMSLTLAIASVMDPRLKMSYFDYLSSKGEISGNKLKTSAILDAIRSLYGDYAIHDVEKEYHVSDDSTSSDSEDESPKTVVEEERCDSVQMQEYIQFSESINQSPKSDLDRYLEDPVVSWNQDFNILSWWRVEGVKYPTLAKMARDILAIPMSVATSYESYYKEREADPHIHRSGTDEIMNALACAQTWAEKPLK